MALSYVDRLPPGSTLKLLSDIWVGGRHKILTGSLGQVVKACDLGHIIRFGVLGEPYDTFVWNHQVERTNASKDNA